MLKLFLKNLFQIALLCAGGAGIVILTIELAKYSSYFVALPAVLLALYFAYDKAKFDYELKQIKDS